MCDKNHLFVPITNGLVVAGGCSPIHEVHTAPQGLILPSLSPDGAAPAFPGPCSPLAETTAYEYPVPAAVGELPDGELFLAGKPLVGWKVLDLPNFALETGYEVIHGASPLLGHGHWCL